MLFDAPAHVGDRLLRGDAENLRQAERRDGLNDRRGADRSRPASAAARPSACPMTSSIRYFERHGSTSPASRLTSIRTRPSARRQRRAQMSARASSQAADQRIFFLGASGPPACPAAGMRPVRSARCDC